MSEISHMRLKETFAILLILSLLLPFLSTPGQVQAGIPSGLSEYYIPGEADQMWAIFEDNDNDPNLVEGSGLHYAIGATFSTENSTIYYDHWEDGYDFDPATLTGADESFTAGKGDVFTFESPSVPIPRSSTPGMAACLNSTNPGGPTSNCYDGRDRMYIVGGIPTVSLALWPQSIGTVYAFSFELYPIKPYQTNYLIPVGEDLVIPFSYDDFDNVYVVVQSTRDNNHVTINDPKTGGVEVDIVINKGEVTELWHINSGTTINADFPVQTQFIVGQAHSGATSEARGYTVVPASLWSTQYFSPVDGSVGNGTDLYLYNPNASPITIDWEDTSGSGTITLAAGETRAYSDAAPSGAGHSVPIDSAVELTGSEIFWGIGSVDTEAAIFDWNFSLIPTDALTTEYFLGWAPGTSEPSPTNNCSPVWVTAIEDNTILQIDYSPIDGIIDLVTTIDRLDSYRIYDPDFDNTGMHIISSAPITAAWGEADIDQSGAACSSGSPNMDLGYTVLPLFEPFINVVIDMNKTVTPTGIDNEAGQTVTHSLSVETEDYAVDGVDVEDVLPANWDYVADSTTITYDGLIIFSGAAANPVQVGQTLTWNINQNMAAYTTMTVVFDAITTAPPGETSVNEASATGTYNSQLLTASDTATVYSYDPDLVVSKTNDLIGDAQVGSSFDWSLEISNSPISSTVTFNDDDTILTDNLPAGPIYGAVSITNGATPPGGTGSISCAIAANILTCSASGGTVTLSADASFAASFSVIPAATGVLSNPDGGVCRVDPSALITEIDETNNDCSDEVNVLGILEISKSLSDTDQTHTAGSFLTIGEIATYELIIIVPNGSFANVTATDNLPDDLAFVDCVSVTSSDLNLTTDLPGGFSDACNDDTNPTVQNDGDLIQFTLGNLTNTDMNALVDETLTITFTAAVLNTLPNQDGIILTNSAVVAWDSGTDTSNPVNTTIIEPSLSVAKTANPTSGDAGDQITYTIVINNPPGSIDAFNVSLYDFVPAELVYDPGSFQHTAGLAPDSITVVLPLLNTEWDVFPADSSSEFQFSGVLDTSAAAGDLIYNDAIVKLTSLPDSPGVLSPYNALAHERTGDESDPGGTANDYTVTAPAAVSIDQPAIDKQDPSPAVYTIGESIIFPIVVTLPEGTTNNLVVNDNLPDGLEYVGYSIITQAALSGGNLSEDFSGSVLAPVVSSVSGSGGDVTFTFGDVLTNADAGAPPPDNNSFLINLTARVMDIPLNSNGDVLDNTASLQFTDPTTLETITITDDPVSISLIEPEMNITKSFDPNQAAINETVQVTLVVSNTGTSPAYDVIIEDPFPTSSFQAVAEGTTPGDFLFESELSGGNYIVRYSGGPIEADGSRTFTFFATVGGTFPSGITIDNTATVTQATTIDGPSDYERDEPDVSASDTLTAISPDLAVTKDDGQATAVPGEILVYTITIENVGLHSAEGITVSDTIPMDTTFNAGSSDPGWGCSGGEPAGTVCTFSFASLASGAQTSMQFAVQINNPVLSTTDEIDNTASATDNGVYGNDPTPINNYDDDIDSLTTAPVITTDKTDIFLFDSDGSGNPSAGDTLRYTVSILNSGNQNAGEVILKDTPDANTELLVGSVTTSQGAVLIGNTAGDTSVSVDLGEIPGAGGTAEVSFSVTIIDSLPVDTTYVENQAIISGTNFSDIPSDDPDLPGGDDPTITLLETSIIKVVSDTNQSHTTGQDAAIGEMVVFAVTLYVPPGETRLSTLTDTLTEGLAFVDCLSITTGSGDLTTDLVGEFDATCANPLISAEPPGSPDDVDQGRVVKFDLGNLTNTSGTSIPLVLTYRAVILNSENNLDGTQVQNGITWDYQTGSLSATAAPIDIVEPDLQIIKGANRTTASNNSVIIFTLRVSHTGFSTTGGFDLEMTDTLPPNLVYLPGTLSFVSGTPASVDDSNPTVMRASWVEFPLGGEETVLEFQARVTGLAAGESTTNTAALSWTSLPGSILIPQSIHNTLSTERYYDPPSEVNIYGDSSSVSILAPVPVPAPLPIPEPAPAPTPTFPVTK